jgi:carbon storage regulator
MALVISRSEKQSFRVGDDIIITIITAKGGSARVAIDAPYNVPIWREELWQKIKAEREREAAAAAADPNKAAGGA